MTGGPTEILGSYWIPFFPFWINIQDALVTAYSCYIVLTRLTRYSFFSWNMKQDEFTRLNEQVRYGMVQHGQRLRFVYVLLRFEDIELLFWKRFDFFHCLAPDFWLLFWERKSIETYGWSLISWNRSEQVGLIKNIGFSKSNESFWENESISRNKRFTTTNDNLKIHILKMIFFFRLYHLVLLMF